VSPFSWFVARARVQRSAAAMAPRLCTAFLLTAMPALAQPSLQSAPLGSAPATVTLAQASDAAWQRAVLSRESDSQTRRARAEQTAASSLWAAPPALEMNHLDDRFHSSAGRRETEVGFVWPLWLPGQRDARSAAADAEFRLAQSTADAARLRIAGQVRESAWRLAAALAEGASVAAQARYLQGIADDVQRRVNAGDLARADALAARGELLETEAARSEVDQRVNAARAQWRTLTGLDAMPAPMPPSVPAGLDGAQPAGDHPELIAAALAVERARKRVDAVNASRRDPPELSLRYREEAPGLGEAAQRGIGIGLKIPLGTDGRNAPLQAAAFGELDVAETTELRLRERQAADVAIARDGLQSAARQLDSTRIRAQLLRERAQLVERSFKAGESALPELLRAANAAAQAEAALARQHAAVGLAHAQLQQALGLFP
jgi:cobalt-zinc-cadmium efflux system outer membrane protein